MQFFVPPSFSNKSLLFVVCLNSFKTSLNKNLAEYPQEFRVNWEQSSMSCTINQGCTVVGQRFAANGPNGLSYYYYYYQFTPLVKFDLRQYQIIFSHYYDEKLCRMSLFHQVIVQPLIRLINLICNFVKDCYSVSNFYHAIFRSAYSTPCTGTTKQ